MAEFLNDIKIPQPFHRKPLSIMSIYSEVLLLMLFIHSTMRPNVLPVSDANTVYLRYCSST